MELHAVDPPPDEAPPPGDAAPPEEARLWERCRRGDGEARQKLLDAHLPYARIVAASYYAKRVSDDIEFGDYLQLATVGLIECIDRYAPALGVHFRSFAARRMHGALIDGLERMTERQQQSAARRRLEQQRLEAIKHGLDAGGASRERNSDQLLAYVAEAGLAFALSWLLDGTGMLHTDEKTETLPFYRSVELRQLRERIAQLVRTLPPQERRVLHEHYFQERPFHDIADAMRLTKGRISQIHHKGLRRLAEALREGGDCDVAW